jgi:hypothetical protein
LGPVVNYSKKWNRRRTLSLWKRRRSSLGNYSKKPPWFIKETDPEMEEDEDLTTSKKEAELSPKETDPELEEEEDPTPLEKEAELSPKEDHVAEDPEETEPTDPETEKEEDPTPLEKEAELSSKLLEEEKYPETEDPEETEPLDAQAAKIEAEGDQIPSTDSVIKDLDQELEEAVVPKPQNNHYTPDEAILDNWMGSLHESPSKTPIPGQITPSQLPATPASQKKKGGGRHHYEPVDLKTHLVWPNQASH